MIVPRSPSPHPSLSSSGSEEVRCSLDELDAVIATFDEEARQQRQNFVCARTNSSAFTSKTTVNGQPSQRRASLSLEDQSSSTFGDQMDYASATLQNPRHAQARSILEPFCSSDDAYLTNQDPEFPPPPPDLFASDNFVLPPPPPPMGSEPEYAVVCPTDRKSSTGSDLYTQPITENQGAPPSTIPVAPATITGTTAPQSAKPSVRPCTGRPGAFKRPAVPQRAPSTRLSSVPVAAIVCNGIVDSRPRSMAADPGVPSGRELKCSSESLPNPLVKSSSADGVSMGANTSVAAGPTTASTTTQISEATIDRTVPPVCDIIRKFDRHGTVTGASCRSVLSQIRPASGAMRDEARTNPVCPMLNEAAVVRKSSSPGNSSTLAASPQPTLSDPETDHPDCSPSLTVQELARGFALARLNTTSTTDGCSTGTVPRANQLVGKLSPKVSSSSVGMPSPAAVANTNSQTHTQFQKQSCPSGRIVSSSPTHLTVDQHSNGHSCRTPLSSFGSARQPKTNGGSQPSPPLPSPPALPPVQSTLFPGRSNSIANGQLDVSNSPAPSCPPSAGSVSVHAMRLDPGTLETLLHYNIVGSHQIPGYQPVPTGLPDWKVHKLERKNRDAADAYAVDLRKWGCVPQWKRELIEKRHHGKTDLPATKICPTPHEAQPEPPSLISAELIEKLQRRLEKVAAVAES